MLQILAGGFLLLQAAWCIACLFRRDVPPLPGEKGRVTNSGALTVIGLVCGGLLGFGAAVCVAYNTTLWFVFLPVLGTILVSAGCLPCIRWNAEGFTVRTAFGRTHECTWEDILGWSRPGGDVWLRTTKGVFLLDDMADGHLEFFREVSRRCKNAELISEPWDVFNGHVQNPQTMLGLMVFFVLLGVGLAGFGLHEMQPLTADNTQAVTLAFDRYEDDGDAVNLYSGDTVYRIKNEPDRVVRTLNKTGLAPYYEARVQQGEKYTFIYALTAQDGTVLLTLDEVNRNGAEVGVFLLVLCALLLGMVVMILLVGRHPERFSERWRDALFKPGTLTVLEDERRKRIDPRR